MDSDGGESERLLPPSGSGEALRKSSSSRFQVSLAANEGSEESDALESGRKTKSVSEPPPPRNVIERKMSSTGRFTVSGPDAEAAVALIGNDANVFYMDDTLTNTAETADTEDVEGEEPACQIRKGVHFSVGDRNDDDTQKSVEGQTTINLKSWRNMKTLEHPPIIDFYRNSIDADAGVGSSRPSMSQLIHGEKAIPEEDLAFDEFKAQNEDIFDGQVGSNGKTAKLEKFAPPTSSTPRTKFGWMEGVFVRCLLNIFGVMLYLRIGWVAGQAGLILGCCVVLLASTVTTITALSTCAICTNGDVKGGGAYFLISRSLGPEFGGSIGLIFSVANAVGGAMYVVGFAETIRDIIVESATTSPALSEWVDSFGQLNIVRMVGVVTCLILMGIVFIGTSFESKMQLGLLAVLLASIVDYMIGTVVKTPTEHMTVRGVTGYNWNTMLDNLMPAFRGGENFFTIFAVYFPAATGIMAGANISGDLADPQKAIPKGTLLAIFSTTIIYLIAVWMTGTTCVRDADGVNPPVFDSVGFFVPPNCTYGELPCNYGLMNYNQVMEMESLWGPLITAGIFAATLSSALASLVSAPKVFQAVCKDRLFPKIGFFAKGYGKDEEPRRAYILAAVIALGVILVGDLNAIAPIISNFFLASYALINYACFDNSFADSPGFRPGFKYYNMWVSLAGSVLCVCVMFIISWSTALLTFFFFAVLFMYILHRKPDVNWGSSTQAHSYKNALAGMVKLSNTEEHVKNYRPQLLVLTGNPASRPSLVDFVNNITKGSSLMICGYVVPYAPCDRVYSVLRKLDRQMNDWLRKKKVKSFYISIANQSVRAGVQALYQTSGLGRLRPNIVIIGFKCNWADKGPTEQKLDELNDYFGVIQDAFECNMGVGVLRNQNAGLDFSENMRLLNIGRNDETHSGKKQHVVNKEPNGNVEKETEDGKKDDDTNVDADANTPSLLIQSSRSRNSARSMDLFMRHHLNIVQASSSFTENFPFDFDLDDEEDEETHRAMDSDEETDTQRQQRTSRKKREETDIEKGTNTLRELKNTLSLRRRGRKKISLSELKRISLSLDDVAVSRRATVEQKALLASISRFNRKVKRGVIDVWWLYDDGGLTLLIPHLLTIDKSYLEGARLRVFTISTSSRTMEAEQRSMAALLSKFRIDFCNVSVIADIGRKPRKETMDAWENLIEPFIAPDGQCPPGMTSPSELSAQREKTFRQLRTSELLQQHSSQADLVVITLPVPRKGLVSASLYMSWLDMMTRGLPPSLLIRGNQTSVLTFYS